MNPLHIIFSQNRHFNIFFMLMMIAVATLPFTHTLSVPITILMLINWIWEWNWKEKLLNVKDHQATSVFALSTAVFCLTLLGLLISSNKTHALASIETYIWFLAAPLFLLTYPSTLLTHERTRLLLVLFTISTILLSMILFGDAAVYLLRHRDQEFSIYSYISSFYHPSYLSLYISFAIFLLLFDWKNRNRHFNTALKIIYGVIIVCLYTAVISLSSKAGLLLLIVLCFCWIFYLANGWKKQLLGILAFLSVNLLFGALAYQFKANPLMRLTSAWDDIQHYEVNNSHAYTSSGVRLTVWRSAWEISKENHLLGTGTGDLGADLMKKAEERDYRNLIGHHYNTHSQWLQALSSCGLVGLLVVLAYCLYPLIYGIRKRDMLYLTFSLLIIGNLMVESMFERKMGAVFIAMMYILLFLRISKEEIHFNLE